MIVRDGLSLSAGRTVAEEFRSVPAMIEATVDRCPDRIAVGYDGRTLSYRRLDALANGLAGELADLGVARGSILPSLLVNSLELPVAYLAAFKLGAVFVPLDPSWPDGRLRAALDALASPLVLVASDSAGDPHGVAGHPVQVDQLPLSQQRPGVLIEPGDLSYGIFTSGTTGAPKCALNYHGGLANRFRFMSRYFGATGEEVVLQNSKHTFDSSLWQLLWPLTEGAQVVLPIQREFLNLHQTIDTIATHRVTAADFVSSIFNALMAIVDSEPDALAKLRSLRWLVVGSEPVNPRAVQRLMSLLPGLRITNGYGPTETSIGMAFHPMSSEDGDAVPLGRPIDNCHVAIVDDRLRLLPVGQVGEVAVGGACVGHGYLRAPGVTASAFVPNPFPDEVVGDRLYRTGDLGQLDEHGRLFFLGRRDFQVKIGGMRIELGEIASAAERCPGVLQAQVLVGERGGDKVLGLFTRCDAGTSEAALRERLRAELPRTSLPAYYFLAPELPLGDNGKVDREELQRQLDDRISGEQVAPPDPEPDAMLAGTVLRVMRSVLARPNLGPFEHFLDAGGDSLKAVSVIDELRRTCSVPQICAQDLFDHPTADRMSLVMEMYLADAATVESEYELMARDADAGAAIAPSPPVGHTTVDTVLLTGATGFVGSYLAYELLSRGLRVICLVREGDDSRARGRVVEILRRAGRWRQEFDDRLDAVAGDLNLARLGLREQAWQRLAGGVDLVLHAAARVNFLFDYRAHRRANVLGTAELLRLALDQRPVPFHHVSTLAALQGALTGSQLQEIAPDSVPPPPHGYNQSKWVAERYLNAARTRGAVVTLLRRAPRRPAGGGTGRPLPGPAGRRTRPDSDLPPRDASGAGMNALRPHAEDQYADELALLAATDDRPRPPGWRLSPHAVVTYLLGDGAKITPKYVGSRRLIEVAVSTLVTDRALLLLGVPGTAKTWVSEHLAAAVSGDSTLLVQGTAGTAEEAIRYGWNYARLLAEGPTDAALVPSPVMRAMQIGSIARVEELTRVPSDVQDALITILSEKTLPVPELNTEVAAAARLQPDRHRERPRPGCERAVQRAAAALQHGGAAGAGIGRRGGRRSSPGGWPSSAAPSTCPTFPRRWTRSGASSPSSGSCVTASPRTAARS